MADNKLTTLTWTFQEYLKEKRTRKWYFWAILLVLAVLVYAVATVNYLFALIVLIAVVLFWYNQQRNPELIEVEISESGITVHGRQYSYDLVKEFWLIYQPPKHKDLYLSFKRLLNPILRIPLADTDPNAVRELLSRFLPENVEQESAPLAEELRQRLKL